MKVTFCFALVCAVCVNSPIANAQSTPSASQAEAHKKIEAAVLAQANAKCAKDGKVAVATHVGSSVLFKCTTPDDPEYKAQQEAPKPAQ
jgi:hypothetical protein